MRPLLWGTIWFIIGMVGWVTFSIICGVSLGVSGECSGVVLTLVYFFGLIFFFSLPISIVIEVIKFAKNRGK